MNTVSEYCDCNKEVANKFENLNKVGSRGKCMEDLRDVFWSMFEIFEVIGVLAVQRLAMKSAHRSTLRGVAQQCKQLETDPLPCGTLKSCSAVRCQVQGGLFCPDSQRRGS
jgi:hypothetical protein